MEAFLGAEGVTFFAEPFHSLARTTLASPLPLGSSLASYFGYIYIQDRSSMLPPLALNPRTGAMVLDMCASPGSKTGLLSQLVGPSGLVVANEPNHSRLATLRQNLRTQNLLNVVTCSYPGEELPFPRETFSWILADVPCSGWGTSKKNSQVTTIWREEKTGPLVQLQRRILSRAVELLAPGGRLVYSTCTTNPRENEEQILWAMQHFGLTLSPLTPFPGFEFALPTTPRVDGSLCVVEGAQSQGFFISLLTKPGRVPRPTQSKVVFPATVRPYQAPGQSDLSWEHMPAGQLVLAGDRVYFLPTQALTETFSLLRWQGFPVGKIQGSQLRIDPRLRWLVPKDPQSDSRVCEDIAEIRAFLSGQSLICRAGKPLIGWYYRGLPLGWLTTKAGRCLWTDRMGSGTDKKGRHS